MLRSTSWETILLVLALVSLGLAAFKVPELPRWSWGWGGAFIVLLVYLL